MKKINLVVIEDEMAHFSLIKRALHKKFSNVTINHFKEAGAFLEKFGEIESDIIITDYIMPDMNGLELMEILNNEESEIPIIMITGQGNENVAVRAMKLGVWDYLVKSADFFSLLPKIIEKILQERDLRTSLQESQAQVKMLSQQLIKAQEIERQQVACDLHDNIGQDLSSLKIGLDTLYVQNEEIPAAIREKALQFSRSLQKIVSDVRKMAYELRPDGLDELGLVQTIANYCEDFTAKNKIKIDFLSAGMQDLDLDSITRITIYRLVQEALNNIKKHSGAKHAVIRLIASFPNIILRVEDNGRGFDLPKLQTAPFSENRMDLKNMRQRAALLHGTMKIDSKPGQGTKILIKIPIGKKNSE